MRLLGLVGILLVACGGSPKHAAPPTPDPIPKTAGPSCKDVAANLATLTDHDPTKDASQAASPIQARCEGDHWSDEARSCFATATSEPELDGCKTKLTDAQRQAFSPVAPEAKPTDPWGGAKPADSDDDSDDKKGDGSHHTRGPIHKGHKTSDPCEGGE